MKILNIIQCTNLGGMERSNLARLKAFQSCGHECHLVSLNAFGDLLPLLRAGSVPHNAFDYGRDKFGALKGLAKQLRTQEHDVVVCTGHSLIVALALPLKRKPKQVLCIHFHHTGVKSPWFWRFYYRLATRKFCHVFFNSGFIRDEALALLPALKEVSSVLPNVYELPSPCDPVSRSEAKVELGFPEEIMLVSNAGWLIPRKRFDIFIQVAAAVKEKMPNVAFMIAGDGDERDRLKRLARDIGLESDILWLGWQENLDPFYSASDLILFNTDWDAVARTPIEAGLRGVSIVCSEVNGGLSDLFEQPDWILKSHDVDRLAAMVVELLDDPQKRTAQIEDIQGIIKGKCAPDVHVRKVLDQVYG